MYHGVADHHLEAEMTTGCVIKMRLAPMRLAPIAIPHQRFRSHGVVSTTYSLIMTGALIPSPVASC